MASPAPAKLQRLHNFSLTHLKWNNHPTGRSRQAGESESSSQHPCHAPSSPHSRHIPPPANAYRRPSPLHRQSPIRDSDPNYAGSQFTERTSNRLISESSTKSVDYNHKGKKSNRIKQRDTVTAENQSSTPMDSTVPPPAAAEEDESLPKTWNLRPRRPPVNLKQFTIGLQEKKTCHEINTIKQSSEVKNNNNSDLRKTKKMKFSVPLSRGEIEEDLLLLTGSKPSRRPKKRPRAIQKQLDNIFPGLWLDTITADSYKVSETCSKE